MANASILLCGSSSVGKSTLMADMPANFNGMAIETVKMDFTSIREQLGNPSWDLLASDHKVGQAQQEAGMGIYETRIGEISKRAKPHTLYVFERTPLDIAGYSFAFGLTNDHIIDMLRRAGHLLARLSDIGPVLVCFRPVDHSFPYNRRDNTRPSEVIRDSCNWFLEDQMRLAMNRKNNVKFVTSVNHGSEETDWILSQL